MYLLFVLYRYLWLKSLSVDERACVVKRFFLIGGKAAPGYFIAKRVIKFAHAIGELVNNDSETSPYLRLFYFPNYCVSAAEHIVPSSDISEHISVAGTEASGTSNMKFAFNGGLIIGTMDGANIEIANEVGKQNLFTFGVTVDQVEPVRAIVC